MPGAHARVEHPGVASELELRHHVVDVAARRVEGAELRLLCSPRRQQALVDVAYVAVRERLEALRRKVEDELGEDVLRRTEVVVRILAVHEREVLFGEVEGDLDELAPAVLLDHGGLDLRRQLLAQRTVRLLVLRVPRRSGVANAPTQEACEDRDGGRSGLRLRARQELAHDPVEARQMSVLAEAQEEDFVQVVERGLRDHLARDLWLAVFPYLRDLAVVERAHSRERLRAVEEPAPELPNERRRSVRLHDLDRLRNL